MSMETNRFLPSLRMPAFPTPQDDPRDDAEEDDPDEDGGGSCSASDDGEYDDNDDEGEEEYEEEDEYEDEYEDEGSRVLRLLGPVVHPSRVSLRPVDVGPSSVGAFLSRCRASVPVGRAPWSGADDSELFESRVLSAGGSGDDGTRHTGRSGGGLFLRDDESGTDVSVGVPGGMFGATMDALLSSRGSGTDLDPDRRVGVVESADVWRREVLASLTPPSDRIGHPPTLPPEKRERCPPGTVAVAVSVGSIWDVTNDPPFDDGIDDDEANEDEVRWDVLRSRTEDGHRSFPGGGHGGGGGGGGGDEPVTSSTPRKPWQETTGSFSALALELVDGWPARPRLSPSESNGPSEERKDPRGEETLQSVAAPVRRRRRPRPRPFTIPAHLCSRLDDTGSEDEDDIHIDDGDVNGADGHGGGGAGAGDASSASAATLDWLRRRKDGWRVLRALVRSNRIVEQHRRFAPPTEARPEGRESLPPGPSAPCPVLLDPDLPSHRSEDETAGAGPTGNVVHCSRRDLPMAPRHLARVLSSPSSCPPNYSRDPRGREEAIQSARRDFARRVADSCGRMDPVPASLSSANVGCDSRPALGLIWAPRTSDGVAAEVHGCERDALTDSSFVPSPIRHDDEIPPPSGGSGQSVPASASGGGVDLPSAVSLVRGTTGPFGRGLGFSSPRVVGRLLPHCPSRDLQTTNELPRRRETRTVSQIMRLSDSPVGLFFPHRTETEGGARGSPSGEAEGDSPDAPLPPSMIGAVRCLVKGRGSTDELENLRVESGGYPLHGWDGIGPPRSSPSQSKGQAGATDAARGFRDRAVERQRRDSARELLHTGCRMRRTVAGKCTYRGMLSDRVVDPKIYQQRYFSMLHRSRPRRRAGASAVSFDRQSIPPSVLPPSILLVGVAARSSSATDCVMFLLQHHLAALGIATSQQKGRQNEDPCQSPLKSPRAVLLRTKQHPLLSSQNWGREKSGNQIGGGQMGLVDHETAASARRQLDLSSRLFQFVADGFDIEANDYAERVLLTKMGFLAETVRVRGELLHLFAKACEVAREDEAFLAEMAVVGGGLDETACDSPFFTKRKSSELLAKPQEQPKTNSRRTSNAAQQPMEEVPLEDQTCADNAVTSKTADGICEDAVQEPRKKKRKKSKVDKGEKKKRKKGKRSKKRKKRKTADTTDHNGINTVVPRATDEAMPSQSPPVAKISPPPPQPPPPAAQPQPAVRQPPLPRPQPQPPHVSIPPGLEFTPVVQKVHLPNAQTEFQADERPKNATNPGTAESSDRMEGSQEVVKRPAKQMMRNFFALHGSSTTEASSEVEPKSHPPGNTLAKPLEGIEQPVPVSDQRKDDSAHASQLEPLMSQPADPPVKDVRPSIPRLCPPKAQLRVLCSEAFLEEYSEAVSQLASGSWTRSFFSESLQDPEAAAASFSLGKPSPSMTTDVSGGGSVSETTNLGRRIVLCDSPLADRVGIDVELPLRCGIVLARLSSWAAAAASAPPANGPSVPPPGIGVRSGGREFVRRVVGLAATGRYTELHVLLCTDAAITPQVAGDVAILQNAILGQTGCPCSFVNVQFVAPATTLSAAVAVKALQACSGSFGGRAQDGPLQEEALNRGIPDWVETFSSDPNVQQRANFLLSLAPSLSVISCLEFLRHCSARNDALPSSTSPEQGGGGCSSFGQLLREAATDPGRLLRALRDDGAGEITLRSVRQISNGVRAKLCRQGP